MRGRKIKETSGSYRWIYIRNIADIQKLCAISLIKEWRNKEYPAA